MSEIETHTESFQDQVTWRAASQEDLKIEASLVWSQLIVDSLNINLHS